MAQRKRKQHVEAEKQKGNLKWSSFEGLKKKWTQDTLNACGYKLPDPDKSEIVFESERLGVKLTADMLNILLRFIADNRCQPKQAAIMLLNITPATWQALNKSGGYYGEDTGWGHIYDMLTSAHRVVSDVQQIRKLDNATFDDPRAQADAAKFHLLNTSPQYGKSIDKNKIIDETAELVAESLFELQEQGVIDNITLNTIIEQIKNVCEAKKNGS